MTRSLLQPIRTRRVVRSTAAARSNALHKNPRLTPTTRKTLAAIGALWISFASTTSADPTAARHSPENSTAPSAQTAVERGRYIVEGVGLCADCHTPRTEKGEFDRSRWLLGSTLPFQPSVPMPWSPAAPPIAGLPSMNEAQGVVFLTTGKRPDGSAPRPPMPEYRLNRPDASAVIAYLKSLSK